MDKMTERPCPVCMRGSGFDRCSHSTCPMRKHITASVPDGSYQDGVMARGSTGPTYVSIGGFRKMPTCKD